MPGTRTLSETPAKIGGCLGDSPWTEAKPKGMTDEERAEMERAVRSASTKSLVLEVRRRGWIVTKPK